MKKFIFRTGIAVAAAVFAAACATPVEVPEWVGNPPSDTSEYRYFTGIGSDAGGDDGRAREEAAASIVSDITRYLGVRIRSDTTVEARDAYGEFESKLTAVISEQSSARLSGMRIRDTWSEYGENGVDVHMLVEYSTAELEEEKARLEALFREKQEAISCPEKKGDELYSEGKYYKAAVKFVEAALAASSSDLENAELKFERNITKARGAVGMISIRKISGPESAYLGEAFGSVFKVRTAAGSETLAGLPVSVIYQEMRANGRKTIKTSALLTDESGTASFEAPVPDWVGSGEYIFFLDMRAVIEPLENVSFGLLQYVDAFKQEVNSKRVSFEYEVLSRALEIPTCLMVMDVDRSGNPLDKMDTAAGILSEMSRAGFNVYMLPVDYRMTAVSDSQLIRLINDQYGALYDRLIFGTAEISSFEESGNSIIVKVTGRIKAVDLGTGKILYTAAEQKRARGNSNSGTISAAFTSLGRSYGEKLISDLP